MQPELILSLILISLLGVTAVIMKYKYFKEVCQIVFIGLLIGMSIQAAAGELGAIRTLTGSATIYYPTYNGSGITDFDKPRIVKRNGRLRTTIPGTNLPDLGSDQSLGYKARGSYTADF